MVCRRCPHHVRHGQVAADKKTFVFKDRCSLKMKSQGAQSAEVDCEHYPFKSGFNYIECGTYQHIFKSGGQRNDVIPTSDFQYTDAVHTTSITEMELL